MNQLKKILAALLCVPLIVATNTSDTTVVSAKNSEDLEIWSTYATEKILQERTDIYDSVRMSPVVEVEACKGEYESAQVIMTAKKDISYYNAEIISDLVSTNGNTFSKSNIELRHEKYLLTEAMSDYNNPPSGYYPDALVPLEKIVEYGENKIEAGKNQGLYVTFWVPVEQSAGVYTGSMKIEYDGKEESIPVKLTVYDLTVSQETRTMSYFNLGFSQHLGDKDTTQAMWRTYTEELIKYRLAPGSILRTVEKTDAKMEEFVEEAADLVLNHGLSTISIPGIWKSPENFSTILVMLAEKSIELNYNLLEKVMMKGRDEPKLTEMSKVIADTADFQKGLNEAEKQIEKLSGANSSFIDELAESVQAIPYVITLNIAYDEQMEGVDTHCPLFNIYDSEENRALYDNQWKGRWWYGCVGPRPPYPTYHMEDTLVSTRSVGWMMSEYDIVGNLYWCTTVYAAYAGVVYTPIEDYYSTPERYYNGNGDGYLFYPGVEYGIEGPLASLRLEAIRDGNEEYELLYDLNAAYEAAGYSADVVQRNISDLIYSGTRVKYNNISSQFAAARKAMLQLCLLAKEGIFITNIIDDGNGNITYELLTDSNCVVKNAGNTITGTAVGDKIKYVVVCQRTEIVNKLDLSFELGDKEYKFGFNLGGKIMYYTANALLEDMTLTNQNATVTSALEGEKLRLDIGAVEGKHQNIRITSNILSSIGSEVNKLTLNVENPTDEDLYIRILVRLTGAQFNTELYAGTLKPGANSLTIDLSLLKLTDTRRIQRSDFYFSMNPGDYAGKTVYLNSLTLYYE